MSENTTTEDTTADIGWYVSDVHCRKAIGFLSVELVQQGYLPSDFEFPVLFGLWAQALDRTMDMNHPSPIGPDPELAKQLVNEQYKSHLVVDIKDIT